MQIVTTREFRAHQKRYFDLAEHEKVYVTRKNARPIVISVADDDVIHTPNAVTLAAMQEAQSGKALEELDVDNTSSKMSTGGEPNSSVTMRCTASLMARARVRCSPWEAWVLAGRP